MSPLVACVGRYPETSLSKTPQLAQVHLTSLVRAENSHQGWFLRHYLQRYFIICKRAKLFDTVGQECKYSLSFCRWQNLQPRRSRSGKTRSDLKICSARRPSKSVISSYKEQAFMPNCRLTWRWLSLCSNMARKLATSTRGPPRRRPVLTSS